MLYQNILIYCMETSVLVTFNNENEFQKIILVGITCYFWYFIMFLYSTFWYEFIKSLLIKREYVALESYLASVAEFDRRRLSEKS